MRGEVMPAAVEGNEGGVRILRLGIPVIGAMILLAACATDRPEDAALREVPCPAGPGSGEPELAAGPDGGLYLAWVEPHGEATALRFAPWEGGAWGVARTVAEGPDWFVNWADAPSLAVGAGGRMAAHWLRKEGEGTYAYGIRVALSGDGGATWATPVTPHTDGTETEHGFASLVSRHGGGFDLVWLDGRETGGGGHDGESGMAGAMTLRYAFVGPDGVLAHDRRLDARVCDCCPTDAVRLADGTLLAAYRDRSDTEIRDIAIVRGVGDTWSTPHLVHEDGWRIPGCPVNGPALDARGDRVACAWYTMGMDEHPRVLLAFSEDGGTTFGAPARVDAGNPIGRVDVVLAEDGAASVSWIEGVESGARLCTRTVSPGGATGPMRSPLPIDPGRGSGCPRLARAGEGLVVAWTDAAAIPPRVRTALVPAS